MKKFIIISCIALAGLGCKTANLQSNYSNLSRDVLEEKTIAGDLQAAFWLGDDYFLGKNGPKDTKEAFSAWNTIILAIEQDPSTVSQLWFKQAYKNHHPVAVAMQLFYLGNISQKAGEDEERWEQFGKAVDIFLSSKAQYPQYDEFFIKAQDLITEMGEISYTIGQKYYDEQRDSKEVYQWANRACELRNKEGCVLALKTF